jgi:hypothetical protein
VKARGHRDLLTLVGHAATISAGEWITATGGWVNDHAASPPGPVGQATPKPQSWAEHGRRRPLPAGLKALHRSW